MFAIQLLDTYREDNRLVFENPGTIRIGKEKMFEGGHWKVKK